MNTLSCSMLVLALCVVAARAQLGPAVAPPPVPILSRTDNRQPDGAYTFSYLTGDGARVMERGVLKTDSEGNQVIVTDGNYAYTSPDGTPISLSYIADENGFRARGAHLPTPPPSPQ